MIWWWWHGIVWWFNPNFPLWFNPMQNENKIINHRGPIFFGSAEMGGQCCHFGEISVNHIGLVGIFSETPWYPDEVEPGHSKKLWLFEWEMVNISWTLALDRHILKARSSPHRSQVWWAGFPFLVDLCLLSILQALMNTNMRICFEMCGMGLKISHTQIWGYVLKCVGWD